MKKAMEKSPGISFYDNNEYVTPQEISGKDDVFVSRLRRDFTVDNGLSLWCVSDNLRKGAALNAIQIAEMLIEKSLIKKK